MARDGATRTRAGAMARVGATWVGLLGSGLGLHD